MALPRLGRRPAPVTDEPWTRAVDRMGRAVRRYHDKVAMIPDRRLRTELLHIGEQLDSALRDVVAAGGRAEVRAGRDDVALHAVGRAATLAAHATEAAMTASDAFRHARYDHVTRCLDGARTLVKAVRELADVCLPAQPGVTARLSGEAS